MGHKHTTVAVIGRPNVGKSTLFNRLVKERRSIVDDTPGVTRDRLYADIDWNGKAITLIDTGGLIEESKMTEDVFAELIKKQAYSAVEESDFIIFLVDGKSGVTSRDEKIASNLRKLKNTKKIFLAVNKIDTEKQADLVHDFHSLGLGEPYPISALSGSSGLADILDEIALHSKVEAASKEEIIKIAIVGKPNVGKSSILNCIIGKERAIVSPVAGTTRDSIDTPVRINGKEYILIDTAGLKRKSKITSVIERYATTRAIASIEKADVVLLVVDSTFEITEQDQKIAALIKRRNKPSVILVNKWDLIEEKLSNTMNIYQDKVLRDLHFVDYSKILFVSAVEKKNIYKIWPLVEEVYTNYKRRISTSKLNKVLEDILLVTSPPTKKGKMLKIYYATQTDIMPPEIVLFVNDNELAPLQFEKHLEREFRKSFDLAGTPIKLVFRNKNKE